MELERKGLSNLSVGVTGDAHPSRLRDTLQSRGNVDAVAQEITASDYYVTNMDADTEAEGTICVYARVQITKSLLDLDGTLDCIDDRREFRQHAVASGISDPAPMVGYEPVHYLPVGREGPQGADLILAYQPGV
jgi:hypothetical protein